MQKFEVGEWIYRVTIREVPKAFGNISYEDYWLEELYDFDLEYPGVKNSSSKKNRVISIQSTKVIGVNGENIQFFKPDSQVGKAKISIRITEKSDWFTTKEAAIQFCIATINRHKEEPRTLLNRLNADTAELEDLLESWNEG